MKHRIFLGIVLLTTISTHVTAQNRTHRRRGIILGGLAGAALGVAIGDKGDNETAGALIGAAAGAIAGGAIGNQKDQRIEQEMRFRSGTYGREIYPYPRPTPYPSQTLHPAPAKHHYDEMHIHRKDYHLNPAPTLKMRPAYDQPYVFSQRDSHYSTSTTTPPASSFHYEDDPSGQQSIDKQRQVPPLSLNDVLAMTRNGVSPSLILRQLENVGFQGRLRVADIIALHQSGVPNDIIEAMQIHSRQGIRRDSVAPPGVMEPTSNAAIENILPPPASSR